jgi:hypothetical protein
MTRRHNRVVRVLRREVEEYIEKRFPSEISASIIIREECLSEEVQSLRPYLNFVRRIFRFSHTVSINNSCPYGRISYGTNMMEKVCLGNKEKYGISAQETSNIREMHVNIFPIIISPLGAVHARSLEALQNVKLCDDKAMKKIENPLSEAAIARSMEIWQIFAQDIPHTDDPQVIRTMT